MSNFVETRQTQAVCEEVKCNKLDTCHFLIKKIKFKLKKKDYTKVDCVCQTDSDCTESRVSNVWNGSS